MSISFGETQAKLNSGDHDEGLPSAALTSTQLEPKKRGFRSNCRRLYLLLAGAQKGFNVQAAKYAIRSVKWANIIVGSLAREVGKFKGIELIREFGEGVLAVLEHAVELSETDATSPKQ